MIFEELHRIQDNPKNGGYLPESELQALSRRINLPLYRIQEVASFFPHFRLTPPPAVQVRVCRDMACSIKGAAKTLQKLQALGREFSPEQLSVEGVSCLGRCDRALAACVNEEFISGEKIALLPEIIRSAVAGHEPPTDADPPLAFAEPDGWKIDPYDGAPEYRAIREFVTNPDSARVLKEIEIGELLGMGGAGAPAFRKWTDVWQANSPEGGKFVVCNGDESEPGTFKDRELLLYKPHLVVEGVALAGLVLGATRGYIFIRHEYPEQIAAVRRAIAAAEAANLCGEQILGSNLSCTVEVFTSPGGYICGEQGALIETLEGKRGQPRNRPPQLESNGLFNKPTLLSNVETYAWAPAIALYGGAWYRDSGINGSKGRRFFSVSGDVRRPGAYEVPIGLPLGKLLANHCGGTTDGRPPLAIAPSGPSGGFLPVDLPLAGKRVPESLQQYVAPGGTHLSILDLPLDLALFRQLGLMLGAGIVVYGQGRDMLNEALNCTEFFRNETCGKCVPCRLGSHQLATIAGDIVAAPAKAADPAVKEIVSQLAQAMEMTSICGLGVSAPNPLVSWMKYFERDRENPASAQKARAV